jgi:hypothetical protein
MENKEILYKAVVETVRSESNENVADRKLILEAAGKALNQFGMDSSGKYRLAELLISELKSKNLLVSEKTEGNTEKEVGRRKQEVYLIQYGKALEYLEGLTKKTSGEVISLTNKNKKIRDARVSLEKNGYSKAEAKKISTVTKKQAERLEQLLKFVVNKCTNRTITFTQLRELWGVSYLDEKQLETIKSSLKAYGVNFFYTITIDGRSKVLTLSNDPIGTLKSLAEMAKDLFGVKIDTNIKKPSMNDGRRLIKVSEKTVGKAEFITDHVKELMFYIGGILVLENRAVDVDAIISILGNNSYRGLKETRESIFEVVKTYPEYFARSIGNKNCIGFSSIKNSSEIWEELKNKFSPVNDKVEFAWHIGSGLSLEEIQEYFPESYKIRPEANIVVIKLTKSVEDLQRLALLSFKFRKEDFAIQLDNVEEKLAAERKMLETRTKRVFNPKTNRWIGLDESDMRLKNDRVIYEIEKL